MYGDNSTQFAIQQTTQRIAAGIQQVDFGQQLLSFGIAQSLQGAQLAASGYLMAGNDEYNAAVYNANLVSLNLNQELQTLGLTVKRLRSTQTAQMAASGFSVNSMSYMSIANSTLSNYEREAANRIAVADQKRQSILFEGAARRRAAQQQARTAMFQGQSEAQKLQLQSQAAALNGDAMSSTAAPAARGWTSLMTGGFTYN